MKGKHDPGDEPLDDWPRLKALRLARDIDGLLAELENPKEASFVSGEETFNITVCAQAARELAKLHEPRTVLPIAKLLHDSRFTVRVYAAMALGEIGEKTAIPALSNALDDVHASVRMRAAQSLGRLGDSSTVEQLIVALQDDNPNVRRAAAKALAQIGDRTAILPLREAVRSESFRHPLRRLKLSQSLLLLRLGRLKSS